MRFLKKSQEIYLQQKNEQTVAFLSVRSSVYLKFILIWLFFIVIVFFLIWNGLQIQAKSTKIITTRQTGGLHIGYKPIIKAGVSRRWLSLCS
ncbi:hypothetical protein LMB64_00015, partial [Limosilactobacillus reuteri]|uniref:hypothetical protein n=1 Tax=Limosilactobacillus reuteri TaxID=1598 RepID=UPI001E607DFA